MIPLEAYGFHLPESLIAQQPADPPESSRLMAVSRRGEIRHLQTLDLATVLPPRCLLVANDTQVLPARLHGSRKTGGKLEILLTTERSASVWWAMIKGTIKEQESFIVASQEVVCLEKKDELYLLDFRGADVFSLMNQYGEIPLPPYIKRELVSEDQAWYQTTFAKNAGAVAAPTAGLHFSEKLKRDLTSKGHEFISITLHVGPGTFLPVRSKDPQGHQVPAEKAFVSEQALKKIMKHKKEGNPVVAIGTTATRTLETLARRFPEKDFDQWVGLTVTPPFRFRLVDHLLTNFHVPDSSLMLLVSAFAGRKKVLSAYQEAIENDYRFYSYGDLTFFE